MKQEFSEEGLCANKHMKTYSISQIIRVKVKTRQLISFTYQFGKKMFQYQVFVNVYK